MQYEYTRPNSHVIAAPDGCRAFLTDGCDCVLRLTMDWKWTITFGGGEPATIGDLGPILDDRKREVDPFIGGFWFDASLTRCPCEVPAFAAKQIAAGGCGVAAARRVARRMLDGPYHMIGVDSGGTKFYSTTDLTEEGRKMLTAAIMLPTTQKVPVEDTAGG